MSNRAFELCKKKVWKVVYFFFLLCSIENYQWVLYYIDFCFVICWDYCLRTTQDDTPSCPELHITVAYFAVVLITLYHTNNCYKYCIWHLLFHVVLTVLWFFLPHSFCNFFNTIEIEKSSIYLSIFCLFVSYHYKCKSINSNKDDATQEKNGDKSAIYNKRIH